MLPRDQTGSGSTEKVQSGEFLDRLILKNVVPQDSGMYICFVTSNGIGQLTYKAVHLNVLPSKFHWTCFCGRELNGFMSAVGLSEVTVPLAGLTEIAPSSTFNECFFYHTFLLFFVFMSICTKRDNCTGFGLVTSH